MNLRHAAAGLLRAACILILVGSAAAQGGQLVSAEWGVPGRRVDVTAQVRTFIHDGIMRFQVTRFNLGIDPAPHVDKELIIRVRHWNGEVDAFNYPERSTVNLELDPEGSYERWERRDGDRDDRDRDHDRDRDRDRDEDRDRDRDRDRDHHEHGLRILRAYYGAEGQFVNVTDAVRQHVADGRLFIHVDNYNLGVDPLPGRRKWLRVLYYFDGDRHNVAVEERTDLQLP